MKTRTLVLSLLAAALLSPPALANPPEGLAGELIANEASTDVSPCGILPPFVMEIVQSLGGPIALGPTDTVEIGFAIIPFRQGSTLIVVDDGLGGATIFGVSFKDGLVAGLPYNRQSWNDVLIEMRPATQDLVVTVNGARSAPQPFTGPCPGGCFNLGNLRLIGGPIGPGVFAWLDTLSAIWFSPDGSQFLVDNKFDAFCAALPSVSGGAIVLATPPPKTKTKP